ncbi:MAG: hypothetical protein RBU37_04085 [Myxococcota bacterium]|jgi:hypothetical protein|nr:hypothetical protein [Myxococcota bacterium]
MQTSMAARPFDGTSMHCSDHDMPDPPPELSGWRFPLASTAIFLPPLLFAIIGATQMGDDQTQQLFGALLGLVLGMVLVALIARNVSKFSNRNTRKNKEMTSPLKPISARESALDAQDQERRQDSRDGASKG